MPNKKKVSRPVARKGSPADRWKTNRGARECIPTVDELLAKIKARPGRPRSVDEYVLEAIFSFVNDPPDSESQEGYLAALLMVYKVGLHGDPELVADAERLLGRPDQLN